MRKIINKSIAERDSAITLYNHDTGRDHVPWVHVNNSQVRVTEFQILCYMFDSPGSSGLSYKYRSNWITSLSKSRPQSWSNFIIRTKTRFEDQEVKIHRIWTELMKTGNGLVLSGASIRSLECVRTNRLSKNDKCGLQVGEGGVCLTAALRDSGAPGVVCKVSQAQTMPRHVLQCLSSGRHPLFDVQSVPKRKGKRRRRRSYCTVAHGETVSWIREHTTSFGLETLKT